MHFGQFNLMGHRARGTSTERVLREAIDQVKLAEDMSFEIAWFAEHHFSNYCVCPSPLMMIAAASQATNRIRLGTAVVVVPLYNPLRLISEIGQADALAGGRLVLGVGSGYQPIEFDRLEADLVVSKPQTEEFMDMIEAAFSNETFTFDGRYYQLKETHIASRPTQAMPEVWIAGDSPALHQLAAERGYIPMYAGRHYNGDQVVATREKINETYKAHGLDPGDFKVAYQRFLCITSSRNESLEYVEHCRHQMRLASNLRHGVEITDGGMIVEQPFEDEPSLEQLVDNLLVGDVATIAERLTDEIRRARPHHVLFHTQVGGSDFRQAMNTIEKFATDIRPLIEKELGPLDNYETRTAAAAE